MLHNTSMASQGGRSFVYITAGLVVGGLLTSAALFRMRKPRSPYRQITVDAGSSLSPAVSPDGALIAYSSDRAEPGNFDIWVQPLDAEGLPLRLTEAPRRDYDPVFSGDGKFIFFESERQPSGIYKAPVTGGPAELVVENAVTPRVSPDGHMLAFGLSGAVRVGPLDGGPARSIAPALLNSFAPVWSPDGGEILFAGKADASSEQDWWIASGSSAQPRKTGLLPLLKKHGFNYAIAEAWLPGDEIVFNGMVSDRMTLWRLGLAPDHQQLMHPPVRATDAAEGDAHASFSAGRLTFDRTRVFLNFWSLPVTNGRVTGELERMTSTQSQKGSASFSSDGKKVLYSAEDSNVYALVMRDMDSRQEKRVRPDTFFSILKPDGQEYVYAQGTKPNLKLYTSSLWGWFSHQICDACAMPRGYSPDARSILLWADADSNDHVDIMDLETKQVRTMLALPASLQTSGHFYAPEFAPDGSWVSFVLKSRENAFRTWIAPLHSDRPTGQQEWIAVNAESDSFQIPFWAPDGKLIYILTAHGGGNLNWLEAQRLDSRTKRPLGQRFPVYEFHEPRVPMMDPTWNRITALKDRIVLELGDISTNVWVNRNPAAQ
jgi:Tol biopolymer transport system component